MFNMISSPKLCDLFFKAKRKAFEEEQLKYIVEQNTFLLRQYDFNFDEKGAEKDMDRLYKEVYFQVTHDFQNRDEIHRELALGKVKPF